MKSESEPTSFSRGPQDSRDQLRVRRAPTSRPIFGPDRRKMTVVLMRQFRSPRHWRRKRIRHRYPRSLNFIYSLMIHRCFGCKHSGVQKRVSASIARRCGKPDFRGRPPLAGAQLPRVHRTRVDSGSSRGSQNSNECSKTPVFRCATTREQSFSHFVCLFFIYQLRSG